ncbi:MAG TPA: ABC transporter permease [Thermoanaerobaculia bacterium]|nr:ABC transporter permease [Thermoanaerobaculia bacterium]
MSGGRARPAARSLLHRLRTLFRATERDRETDEELRFHLEMETEKHRARGLTPEAARQAALRDFGGVEQVREACRDERGLPFFETTARDLRWSLRFLRREPAFSATAIVVLGLGIGAVTAIVPIVHAVLLAPLPYPAPDRLVALWESNPERGWERESVAPANLLDWREQVKAFEGATARGWVGGWALGGGGRPERVEGVDVFGRFFTVLGVPPRLGRDFHADEHWEGGERTVIISHDLWRRRFAGDPGVLGRRIELDGVPRTIVGVAPRGFAYPRPGLDVWVPSGFPRSAAGEVWFRRAHFLHGVARLRPGVSVAAANAELAAVAARLERRYPATNRLMGAGATPLKEVLVGDVRRPLLVLLAAVVTLLLVTCANTAGLLLARSGARAHELGLRGALGASRGRLARQLVTESLVLAVLGGAVGALLGAAGTRLLLRLAADTLPRAHEVGTSLAALGAALGATALAVLLFGVVPALRLASASPAPLLRGQSGGRVAAGREGPWSRGFLVFAEVALAMVLLAGAAITLRSLGALTAVDPGFRPEGRVAVDLALPGARYPEKAQVHAFYQRLLAEARALPGVADAALASSLSLEGRNWTTDIVLEGRPSAEAVIDVNRRIVTPEYFRTAGVRLLRGPGFDPGTDAASPPVVVVNQALARRLFADRDPLGTRLAIEGMGETLWRTVVGVVANERVEDLAAADSMEVFVPLGQETGGELADLPLRGASLLLRARAGDPAALLPPLRARVARLDPEMPLYDARTLSGMLAEATRRERLLAVLLGLFAAIALVLAAVGLYGLIAFTLAARRREIAIRIALGAGSARVAWTTTAWALGLCALGLLVGLPLAGAASQGLAGLLYGVAPADPASLAAAAAVLAATAFAAALLPALRATRVDPMMTLRVE